MERTFGLFPIMDESFPDGSLGNTIENNRRGGSIEAHQRNLDDVESCELSIWTGSIVVREMEGWKTLRE